MLIGRCQNRIPDHPNIGNLQVQAITKESSSKPFPIRGGILKLFSSSGPYKLAHFNRHAVQYLQIMVLKTAHVFKKTLLCVPKIGTLSDKIAAIREIWKQMLPIHLEIFVNDVFGVVYVITAFCRLCSTRRRSLVQVQYCPFRKLPPRKSLYQTAFVIFTLSFFVVVQNCPVICSRQFSSSY
jgi:hypothetical protein